MTYGSEGGFQDVVDAAQGTSVWKWGQAKGTNLFDPCGVRLYPWNNKDSLNRSKRPNKHWEKYVTWDKDQASGDRVGMLR